MDAVLPMHSAVDQLYSNQLLTAHGAGVGGSAANHIHSGSSLTSSSATGTSSSGQIAAHSLQGSAMSLSSSLSLSSSPSPVSSPHAHASHPVNHPSHIMPTSASSTISSSNFADAHINKSSKYSGENISISVT